MAFVAVGMIALLAVAAFVVDMGRAWATRRQLITSTDAAALAAAQDYAFGDIGCGATAEAYLADNYDAAEMTACDVEESSTRSGHVTVDAEITIDSLFAGAVGITETEVGSTTTAHWGQPASVTGLRPVALCIDVVLEGLDPPMEPGNGVTYRIEYGKDDQPDACAGADDVPGNWGLLDLNGGANSNSELSDWMMDGYSGEVSTENWYEGDTGAFSNTLNSELAHLVTLDSFDLPIFEAVTGVGGNAEFLVVAFAKVRLMSYRATGSADNRYLDIQFVEGFSQGTVGGGDGGPDFGVRVVEICAVLAGETAGCV